MRHLARDSAAGAECGDLCSIPLATVVLRMRVPRATPIVDTI